MEKAAEYRKERIDEMQGRSLREGYEQSIEEEKREEI